MKKIIFLFALVAGFGALSVQAHTHSDNQTYRSYYYGSAYHHPDEGHYHHVTAGYEPRHWYHSHGNSRHFHDISRGHTPHTQPYRNYYSYRSYYYDDDKDCDHKKVYGQSYPGRPNMGYSQSSKKSCGCGYRR